MNPLSHYNGLLAETENELKQIRGKITRISIIRVLLFIAGIIGIGCFFNAENWKIIAAIGCTLLPFFSLIKIHDRLFRRKEWLETQARTYREELKGLQGDYSCFDGGKEFIDPEHPYSFDLDLFGNRSLFQAINRTCTSFGKQQLAKWMKNHLTNKKEIEKRQIAINDISQRTTFREQFRVMGLVNQAETGKEADIRNWCESPAIYLHSIWVKAFIWGVPVINSLLLITSLIGLLSISWFGLSFVLFLMLSFAIIKRATAIQETYGNQLKALNSYARLIALSKQEQWKSLAVEELINGLNVDGKSPVDALTQLSKELDRLDLRNNQILYIILEGSVFFQLQQIVRIERWKEHYGRYVMGWLETIGKMDALCSLATFAYNHPNYTYPTVTDTPFCFEATEIGHPLMAETQCIKNDALIPSRPYFLIITGANMAGKSTYLRTIGVNYLLACIGVPVCCQSLIFYPAHLITSLRTSDSLSDNESYFFAELKRLKRIIDLLNEGKELFIILDEILKGTNSADKQKGSFDLIRQFMNLRANGIIATHDLLLGELTKQLPDEIRNYCFEADIKNNELSFSYKLREGIAQNMNACFLMKKMGITIQD